MQSFQLSSHNALLNAFLYVTAGAGRHPSCAADSVTLNRFIPEFKRDILPEMITHMSTGLITRRATVSQVRYIIRDALKNYLSAIGRIHPRHLELVSLKDDLCLPPEGEELEVICNRISAQLFCDRPSLETRAQWTEFLDLYLYFLSRGRMPE